MRETVKVACTRVDAGDVNYSCPVWLKRIAHGTHVAREKNNKKIRRVISKISNFMRFDFMNESSNKKFTRCELYGGIFPLINI